jgi:predicted RNase H-like HicB family nuclease
MSTGRTITLTEEGEWWVAKDEDAGVASQGRTRNKALDNLDEAVALHNGKIGEPIKDEDAFLREIGIDPEEVKQPATVPPWEQSDRDTE